MVFHLLEPLTVVLALFLPITLNIVTFCLLHFLYPGKVYTDCLPTSMLLIPFSRSAMMVSCMSHYTDHSRGPGGPEIVITVFSGAPRPGNSSNVCRFIRMSIIKTRTGTGEGLEPRLSTPSIVPIYTIADVLRNVRQTNQMQL